ncbi:MAG: S41 family peptidase [Candidatus Pacebacteria bacterium]|nr:S41 family peptidase [Candidatus Paceibacterota bacterium]
MNNNYYKKYKVVLIFTLLFITAFFVGIYFGKNQTKDTNTEILNTVSSSINASTTIDIDPLWSVWKILNDKFVYTKKDAIKINDQDKLWGAIQGLTASYDDPYTVFMPPEESKAFDSDISGNFEGVGMELAIKDKNLIVVSPLKGTPSYNAGVKKGDIILTIDGESADGISVDKAVKLIRGKAGTVVTIKFAREGKTEPIEIKITRGVIDVPTVDTEIKNDIFVIRLYNFYATSPDKFKNALRDFIESKKSKLILDLRGNPGGYLEAAVSMASWYLPLGKTVVRENFGEGKQETIYRSKGYDVFNKNLKMIILVDEGSASASEILAGALQEYKIAKLVGTKTFGKGSVQELIKITSDTSLKVTIARWFTPNGISISDGGLTPDYEVKFTEKDFKDGKDPQMEKALELLTSNSN